MPPPRKSCSTGRSAHCNHQSGRRIRPQAAARDLGHARARLRHRRVASRLSCARGAEALTDLPHGLWRFTWCCRMARPWWKPPWSAATTWPTCWPSPPCCTMPACCRADVARRLSALTPPPGRMERVGGNGEPLVVVDYAHTRMHWKMPCWPCAPWQRPRNGRLVSSSAAVAIATRQAPEMGEVAEKRCADRLW
jgi:hypothetical protein